MHELSLAQELIEQLQRVAAQEHAIRIVRVTVEIGPYSGVEADAFEFAFGLAAGDTLAEGAELIMDKRPVTVSCLRCGGLTQPEPDCLVCKTCGSSEVRIEGGREFLIREIELETPDL